MYRFKGITHIIWCTLDIGIGSTSLHITLYVQMVQLFIYLAKLLRYYITCKDTPPLPTHNLMSEIFLSWEKSQNSVEIINWQVFLDWEIIINWLEIIN